MNDELDAKITHLKKVVGNETLDFFWEKMRAEYIEKQEKIPAPEYTAIIMHLVLHFVANEIGKLSMFTGAPVEILLKILLKSLVEQQEELAAHVEQTIKENTEVKVLM